MSSNYLLLNQIYRNHINNYYQSSRMHRNHINNYYQSSRMHRNHINNYYQSSRMPRGGIMQVVAYGAQDVYLTGRPLFPEDPNPSGTVNFTRLDQIQATWATNYVDQVEPKNNFLENNIPVIKLDVCVFTLDDIPNNTKVDYCYQCQHIFTSSHMDHWYVQNMNCPLCRSVITTRTQFIYHKN